MPVFVGDIVKLSIVGRCYSQRIMLTNTYRVSQAGTPGTSVKQNLSSFIGAVDVAGAADIMTPYLDCLQGDYQSLSIRAQVIYPTRLAYVELESVHLGQGGEGSVANDSACLTLRTDGSGRNQIANKHIGPVPDVVSISGVLTPAFRAKLSTLGGAMTASFQPGGAGAVYTPVIFHKLNATSDNVTAWIVSEQSRVQRRRTVGLGE